MLNEKSIQRLHKDRILDVARRHFARFGYRKSSLSEIAADLGVVKGALYYHVPGGKRELLEAVMAREEERLIAGMQEAADTEGNPGLALQRAVEAKLTILRELKDLLGVRREVGEEIAMLLSEREREFNRRERALYEQVLERGEARGSFRAIHPRTAAAAAFQAMVQALEVAEIYAGEDGGPVGQGLLEPVFDLVLRGLEIRG